MRSTHFDGMAVGEISVTFVEQPFKVTAKAAFVNTKNGQTHGWTTCSQWSAATLDKLRELRELMERDLEAIHFADSSFSSTPTTSMGSGSLPSQFKGLGEALGTNADDVPQT